MTNNTNSVTNYVCHEVTEVVDVVLNFLFGWAIRKEIRTKTVCAYSESPYYFVPVWNKGVMEHGSSGSTLLNNDGRIIGTLSGGFSSCSFAATEAFGRLNTAYIKSGKVRNALDPRGASVLRMDGRQILIYENLTNLSGEYYPAKDYQSENQIVLKARKLISNSSLLNIRQDADFLFEAGERIELKPGFSANNGSKFCAKIVPMTSSRQDLPQQSSETFDLKISKILKIEIPENKSFDYSKYIKDFKGEVNSNSFFSLSPNPTNGEFKIHLAFSELQRRIEIQVISPFGVIVKRIVDNDYLTGVTLVSLEGQSNGVFNVKIISDNGELTSKIVLNR